ncbi:Z1 domain-containing protein [Streptomyces lacrimifluminis]|uniref:Endonuclease n=1 Tax=Streptomyces lacrimifluminis TaxID=1500077 RepID=A0A917LCL0_9ACTN|nr:Z1 domain-containing protein [Streptomyces lacrimifluminis]GGJ53493.1 endonuclease [Streptomyces lacrimifluminis]
MADLTDAALTLAKQGVLGIEKHERTRERFKEIAQSAANMLSAAGPVSVDEVVRLLESEFDVWVPQAIVVSNSGDHIAWLENRRQGIEFSYWRRYAEWLKKSWKPSTVESLDEATDQILELLEDPARAGTWKTYGMVYGQVQSGKTASYTGLICKAADAGYQVTIVLTSQHESLRHQTQARLDKEFLGFNSKLSRNPDSDSSVIIGVGTLGMKKPNICQPVTTQVSDFTAAQFQGTPININEVSILVVAKKNARILENLQDWLSNFSTGEEEPRTIKNIPLLLIDDEADYASVDTKRPKKGTSQSDPAHDPTAINKAVRGLLELFDKRAYIAYTATPFANIFIPDETDHPKHGEDLFPKNFLVALEPPSNYCGPEVVFGLEDPSAAEIREPLPITRPVDDHEYWLPDGHRKGYRPGKQLPPSLVEALDAFLLATAVRRVRTKDYGIASGHNTMLVHVTRWTDVQGEIARQIEDHLQGMSADWGDHGKSGQALRKRLLTLWEEDFSPTREEIAGRDDVSALAGPPVSWEEVEEFVPVILEEAVSNVKRINGTAADVLEYQSTTPVTVVAVGGDKLSRGLTLEGLTVSYYLRASKTYDTLLQMGRWFGYRPGYLDVTRLYTTTELVNYYVHITRANRELMDLTAAVSRARQTPKHVGLRVLDGKGNLQVTAATKMRSSQVMTVSLSASRAETLVMRTDKRAQADNSAGLDRLIEAITPFDSVPEDRLDGAGRGFFRQNVPSQVVLDFLARFLVSPRVLTANPENLIPYIKSQVSKGELLRWTVAITAGASSVPLKGLGISLVKRRTITHSRVLDRECEVGVLVSPAHEAIGLAPETVTEAFNRTVQDFLKNGKGREPKRASGESLRKLRDPNEGLLLIYPIDPIASEIEVPDPSIPIVGYAVVFPHSDKAEKVRYRVNQVFLDGLRKAIDEDAEGDS